MAKEIKEVKISNKEELLAAMNKKYGKGSIVGGGTMDTDFEVVSTGSIAFDQATSCGGIPVGKLIEFLGMESAGKSTISLHIIAEFQKAGKTCLLADYEHSFDKNYAETIGVDTDALLIAQPPTMEDGYNMIYDVICSGQVSLVVLDSHTAMISKMRLANDSAIGDAKIAPEARVNSDALRKIHPVLDKYKCSMLGISQMRDAIGTMSSETKAGTGGNSWKFYPDMRVKIFKILDRVNETNKTTIEVIKNKCGKVFGKCTIPIAWGVGIDKTTEIIEIATEFDLIKKSGAWFSIPGIDSQFQGAANLGEFLEDNPEVLAELKEKVLAKMKGNPEENIVPPVEEPEEVV